MLENIIWVPALILLLGTLIFFHELGHFITAKLLHIRVDEFAFGFGPKWIRLFKRGDTEYTIHPVPLGGFVKLAGENPGDPPVPDGFNNRPWQQRFLVYFSGPLFSFLLAYLVFCGLGFTVGLPITKNSINRVDMVMPGSLADQAGLRVGDIITQIDNEQIETGNEMVKIIHGSIDKPLTIHINRKGESIVLYATPEAKELGGKTVGLLGFMATPELKRVGLAESVKYGTITTVAFIDTIIKVVFSKDIAKNVGGPIAIANETKVSVKRGPNGYLQLMAVLSLSLGIINLLPIPIVDGGQMMLLIVEGIRGRRLSQRTMEIAQFIGLATIALIFVLIMFLDLSRVAKGQFFQ